MTERSLKREKRVYILCHCFLTGIKNMEFGGEKVLGNRIIVSLKEIGIGKCLEV